MNLTSYQHYLSVINKDYDCKPNEQTPLKAHINKPVGVKQMSKLKSLHKSFYSGTNAKCYNELKQRKINLALAKNIDELDEDNNIETPGWR